MAVTEPHGELGTSFSSPDATPRPWAEPRTLLEQAELYWLSTVRPDGRPHVTPLIAVWVDDVLYFCTGPDERKAQNLAHHPGCVLTTGRNSLREGMDVVVEGAAVPVRDPGRLQRVADAYLAKYGGEWAFTARGGAFDHAEGGTALVFAVEPSTVFGFAKGEQYSQTRYRFPPGRDVDPSGPIPVRPGRRRRTATSREETA